MDPRQNPEGQNINGGQTPPPIFSNPTPTPPSFTGSGSGDIVLPPGSSNARSSGPNLPGKTIALIVGFVAIVIILIIALVVMNGGGQKTISAGGDYKVSIAKLGNYLISGKDSETPVTGEYTRNEDYVSWRKLSEKDAEYFANVYNLTDAIVIDAEKTLGDTNEILVETLRSYRDYAEFISVYASANFSDNLKDIDKFQNEIEKFNSDTNIVLKEYYDTASTWQKYLEQKRDMIISAGCSLESNSKKCNMPSVSAINDDIDTTEEEMYAMVRNAYLYLMSEYYVIRDLSNE